MTNDDTLIAQLRQLARHQHDDMSLANDAADRIEELKARITLAYRIIWSRRCANCGNDK